MIGQNLESCLDLAQFVQSALVKHLIDECTRFREGRELAFVRRVFNENRRGNGKIEHRDTCNCCAKSTKES